MRPVWSQARYIIYRREGLLIGTYSTRSLTAGSSHDALRALRGRPMWHCSWQRLAPGVFVGGHCYDGIVQRDTSSGDVRTIVQNQQNVCETFQ